MNLNQFMHPRNIYRKKRNFVQLGEEYPEFAAVLKRFPNGNATIDYKNSEAVRILTRTLLSKDFNLDVELPPNRLIPAVPQRLNYVLWIEDLVSLLNENKDVQGVDIGTGASCIFPLLICRQNSRWKMLATEIDSESRRVAESNVKRNQLDDRISVVVVDAEGEIISHVLEPGIKYSFLVCNPPFFQHKWDEEMSSFEGSRSEGNTSSPLESCYDDEGEVGFCRKLILESVRVKDRIEILTVMLGRKKSLQALKLFMKGIAGVQSYTTTELCQGKTMRWALAWTFSPSLDLSKLTKVKRTASTITYNIPYKAGLNYSIEGLTELFKNWISSDLKIDTFDVVRQTKKCTEIWIRSNTNTWSHQRRKRRQEKQQQMPLDSSDSGSGDCPGTKRKLGEDSDDADNQVVLVEAMKRMKNQDPVTRLDRDDGETFLLDASISLRKEKKEIKLWMQTKESSRDGETTHQLLQYLKNRLASCAKS